MTSADTLPVVREDGPLRALRGRVRAFLADELAKERFTPVVDSWMAGFDRAFTSRLASAGFVGMTIPTEYGGHGRSFLERFVVTEELLAAGAPVAAHWFADRQVAPAVLKHGSDEQKRHFLPGIARGELAFAIAMSEPDSGSDLASVRTRATRVDGGWSISGTKVWTSHAHRADHVLLLARSASRDADDRHAGLTQFLVDLSAPGISVHPIVSINGGHDFNELVLDDVRVPHGRVLGRVGGGWRQVLAELGFERSGPERFLSTQLVVERWLDAVRAGDLPSSAALGHHVARTLALHQTSLAVAGAIARGDAADAGASVMKMLGTAAEGGVVEEVSLTIDASAPDARPTERLDALAAVVRDSLLARAGFTLRGGTSEILRGIHARALGLR